MKRLQDIDLTRNKPTCFACTRGKIEAKHFDPIRATWYISCTECGRFTADKKVVQRYQWAGF